MRREVSRFMDAGSETIDRFVAIHPGWAGLKPALKADSIHNMGSAEEGAHAHKAGELFRQSCRWCSTTVIPKKGKPALDTSRVRNLSVLQKEFKTPPVVLSSSCTYTFTPHVSSLCNGHQELANSTYI
jgi:hypothetical protein